MDTPESTSAATHRPIPLHFEITSADGVRLWREFQMTRSRRSRWISRIVGMSMLVLAIVFLRYGIWISLLVGLLALNRLLGFLPMAWLLMCVFGRWTVRTTLEFDETGIRGESQSESVRGWGSEKKRINHVWRRLRKLERFPHFLQLEFIGGSEVIIPYNAFTTLADVALCEAWAEGALRERVR